jgi:HJR/Mrr/RecB family endonuclease
MNLRIIKELVVGELYSNDEIFVALKIGNAGGIRLSLQEKAVMRAAIMASVQDFRTASENPYHDRLENDILTYTAAGKIGEQTLAGVNQRVIEQKKFNFPIHGFVSVASRRDKSVGPKRWKYMGLLEYQRHYPDTQLDSGGKIRRVWIFEFKIHEEPQVVPIAQDMLVSNQTLIDSRKVSIDDGDDDEIISKSATERTDSIEKLEHVRVKLLAMEPKRFEIFIKELMLHCGFTDVCVTKFSSDGGVDVNARAGIRMWLFENNLVQVQAKRWLHSVGRKEVAELRGSLQPFARGVVVTTSHFSKAAINEASGEGKNPIGLIDGFGLSRVILEERFSLQT